MSIVFLILLSGTRSRLWRDLVLSNTKYQLIMVWWRWCAMCYDKLQCMPICNLNLINKTQFCCWAWVKCYFVRCQVSSLLLFLLLHPLLLTNSTLLVSLILTERDFPLIYWILTPLCPSSGRIRPTLQCTAQLESGKRSLKPELRPLLLTAPSTSSRLGNKSS